jgi:hypothetical protein
VELCRLSVAFIIRGWLSEQPPELSLFGTLEAPFLLGRLYDLGLRVTLEAPFLLERLYDRRLPEARHTESVPLRDKPHASCPRSPLPVEHALGTID